MPLGVIPIGTIIHNIELKPGCGGVVSRAAGTYAQLVGKDGGYALIKMQSKRRLFRVYGYYWPGVSNIDKKNISLGKAGRSRWLGIRDQLSEV